MNPIVEEIRSYYFFDDKDDYISHEGVSVLDGAPGRGSGRYPLGSGENPNQRSGDFLSRVEKLRKAGMTETQIAKALDYVTVDKYGKEHTSTTQYRVDLRIAAHEQRAAKVATAKRLRDEGLSLKAIAEKMGYTNDSSVRTLLNEETAARKDKAQKVADFLQELVDSKGMIDVGVGAEREIDSGISQTKLDEALELLRRKGYNTFNRRLEQVTNPGKFTTLRLLCPPGTEYSDVYKDEDGNLPKISSIRDYISYDGGESFRKAFEYPASMDSKRLQIRFSDGTEESGDKQDGLIEIRRGVRDLSLGNSHYAQVRIMVDGTHYIKGMAVYADDLPEGIDVRFNTNKKAGMSMKDVLKEIKDDPNNPFGSLIKEHGGQSYYDDPNGKYTDPVTGKKQSLSLINKRADEGDWGEWSKELPSQFLAKQPKKLIEQQLKLSKADRMREFEDIMSLSNPTVRRVLLQSFADDCDTAAVTLKAAALPRQMYQVILPLRTAKDDEVYAPNFEDGEMVALVRFPHEGTYQIPILKVNNKQAEGIQMMSKNPKDAIGINAAVAERLSGADFDGDTVMVIPITKAASDLKNSEPLKGLEGFDAKEAYPETPGMRYMKRKTEDGRTVDNTQLEMGIISNLIMDMTLRGATEDELVRATKHAQCAIDAGKHKLDYIRSEKENDIDALKRKYQGHIGEDGKYHEGAYTLITRAGAETQVTKRRGNPYINQKGKPWYDPTKEEGALIYKDAYDTEYQEKKKVRKRDPVTGKLMRDEHGNYIYETEVNPDTGKERFVYEETGKTKTRTEKSTQMAETDDAYTLVSEYRTAAELAYADYANYMKSMANRARKEMVYTPNLKYSASAKAAYADEVESLNASLNVALKNAPRERAAQVLATTIVEAKKQSNPDMSKSELKKAKQQALTDARNRLGAKRQLVDISEKEWEAIQAGAISDSQLLKILNHADIDKVRELAMPKNKTVLSDSKIDLISSMSRDGYTNNEIAQRLKVSVATVSKYL